MAVVLGGGLFRYMIKAREKKDWDFMDYVTKREARIDTIVDKHNQAFRENTAAIDRMRSTLEARMELVKEQTPVLGEVKDSLRHH